MSVNRRGVPTPIEQAKLLIHLAMEGSLGRLLTPESD
jgi:hypothetical protein